MSFGNHSKSIETLKIELTTITTERNDLKIKYAELNNNYTILIEKVRTNRKQSHRMNLPVPCGAVRAPQYRKYELEKDKISVTGGAVRAYIFCGDYLPLCSKLLGLCRSEYYDGTE